MKTLGCTGEGVGITLALSMHADPDSGLAARGGLIDLADPLGKHKGTNFHYRPQTIDDPLNEFSGGNPFRLTVKVRIR